MNQLTLAAGLCLGAALLAGCSTPFPLAGPSTPPPSASHANVIRPVQRPPVVVNAQPVAPPSLNSTAIEALPLPATPPPPPPQNAVTDPLKPIIPGDAGNSEVAAVQPPADLWARIRRGFAMPDLDSDLVRNQEQWYATRPDYIVRMTDRSRKYLFHVVEELERRNMPTELALLPFIESAFNPQAVSSAKAAGMWQFIPSTGRDFALKQNVFRDDRRDVLASTRAALDYLQKLHGMFGDWHLALAAYNWGEGSVGRAIAKNRRAGLGTAYTDLTMPLETQQYVPKLQAVKNIVANPESLKVDLPVIENHPYFQRVELTRDIDVKLAAELAKVPLADFKALNPSAHRPVIFASGTPHILLPWDNAEVFRRNLQAHNAGNTASWTAWTAPSTMKVADAAKRVGMTETNLREVNSIPPRYLIKAGSTLLVTRAHSVNTDVSSQVADNGQLALAPEIVLRRVVTKAGKKDTLASMAQRHKVTVANIAEWNKISASASLKAGQAVVLFLPQQARSTVRRTSSTKAVSASAKSTSRTTTTAAGKRTSSSQAAKPRMAQKPAAKRTTAKNN